MFGSHWDKAEATIVASLPKFTGDGSSASYEFVADVRPASGAPPFRATLKEPTIATDFWRPSIGDVVSVLVKSNGKVKFDKDDPRISVKAYEAGRKAAFEAARNQTFEQSRAAEFGSPPGFGETPGGAQVFTVGAADPQRLRAAIEKLRAAGLGGLADQMEQAGRATPGPGGAGDPAIRLAELDRLRARGLLTDEEYATQRRRILDEL